jgi:hypothetical protein
MKLNDLTSYLGLLDQRLVKFEGIVKQQEDKVKMVTQMRDDLNKLEAIVNDT